MDAFTEMAPMLGVSSPYVAGFVLLILGIWVLPFAEAIALITAGYLLSRGVVQRWSMVPVAGVGVFLGAAVLVWFGHRCTTSLRACGLLLQHAAWAVERMSSVFDRYGGLALFCARFLPGVRFPMHVVAGASGMSVPTYVTISGLSIVLYVPLVVTLAYSCGEDIADALQSLHHLGYATWVGILLTTGLWLMLRPWIGARSVVCHHRVRDPIRSPLSGAALNTEQRKEVG
jgi:membrane protein DedA with SNARE-associated domain